MLTPTYSATNPKDIFHKEGMRDVYLKILFHLNENEEDLLKRAEEEQKNAD
jgi:hypothetical protein